MRRVHPLLPPLGIGFTILIFLGLGFSFWQNGSAMFSPGALSAKNATGRQSGGFESHAAFENDCHLCHAPLETTQADLCTRCHTNIMQQVAADRGTHAQVVQITDCRACHPDHQGQDFDPTAAAFAFGMISFAGNAVIPGAPSIA